MKARSTRPFSPLKRLIHRLAQPSSEQGLTLIECLVAVIIIGLVVSTITPALVIAVATRVQSQKSSQALQIAQAEIDRTRLRVERGTYDGTVLPPSTPLALATAVPTPTNAVSLTASVPTAAVTDARIVDVDTDGTPDYVVQMFRSAGTPPTSTPITFDMGVRVYAYSAFTNNSGSLLTDPASLSITGGEGQLNRRPLAVLYTTITRGETEGSLCKYFQAQGSLPASTSMNCD